ncbi:hypothetical protein [Clostridium sp. BJN0001]|uniref:hypothetical protein n=1 Tax=Clostridium sp. BJN0001 TaxID=2930219 RepID=UPI001FD4BC33|nr:hypothetical protein [Clostridium sp. BJN0001]
MIKRKLIKSVSLLGIILSIFLICPKGASAEWKQDTTGWWYREGDYYALNWRKIDGEWYFFDNKGYLVQDCWVPIDDEWYCFDKDGKMAHDTVIDGNKLDSTGKWVKDKEILTKDDFNISSENSDSIDGYTNLIDCFKHNGCTDDIGYYLVTESHDSKDTEKFTTNRGIMLGDKLDKVLSIYGEAEPKIAYTDDIFYKYNKYWKDYPENNYVSYCFYDEIYKYNIRFYFDYSERVVLIAYTVNEYNFPEDKDLAYLTWNK